MTRKKSNFVWRLSQLALGMAIVSGFGYALDFLPYSLFGPWGAFRDERTVRVVLITTLSIGLALNWVLTRRMEHWTALLIELSVGIAFGIILIQMVFIIGDWGSIYPTITLCLSMLTFGLYLCFDICAYCDIYKVHVAAVCIILPHYLSLIYKICVVIIDYI